MAGESVLSKLILGHLFFLVISGAFFYLKPDGPNLVWNMFLALLALDFAYASYVFIKRPVLSFLSMFCWLIFYPNTFYMLTDVIYFTWVKDILWQDQALLTYAVFMSAILLGVACGLVSVQIVLAVLKVRNQTLRYGLVIGLSVLSSLAIYIGRYARLNSWDIFLRPKLVLSEFLAILDGQGWSFILVFIFLQIMLLLLLDGEDFKV